MLAAMMAVDGGSRVGPVDNADRRAVQAIIGRVEVQLEALAERLVERYREDIPDYRLISDDELLRDVFEVSLGALRVTVANLAAGRRPTLDELDGTRAGAARRVHEHISLESFLHAVRLLGRTLWETVMECVNHEVVAEREAALTIAGQLLEHVDLQSIAAAQGYMNALHGVWSDQELLRRDLLDALLAGDGESERVARLARSLHLRLATCYFVIIVRSKDHVAEDSADRTPESRGALRRTMEMARKHLRPGCGALLLGIRHGEIVALHPFDDAAEAQQVREACTQLADELADLRVTIGLSGANPGLATLPVSYSEALEAVEIVLSTGSGGPVVALDDVLIDAVVRGTRHAERIIGASVGRLLEYDEARHTHLVATLRAYVASGFNLVKSAEVLCVHPNTIVYRLGRIKNLSGRDPHQPDDLLLLQLGLKLLEVGPSESPGL
jgi:sugar diacid utilization regulator